jgi:hypothetical protein
LGKKGIVPAGPTPSDYQKTKAKNGLLYFAAKATFKLNRYSRISLFVVERYSLEISFQAEPLIRKAL